MTYTNHADLGGLPGLGAVQPEPEGLLWHAAWEPRAMALTVAMGATGAWNIDQSRSARETLPDYRQRSYYQVWLGGLQRLLMDRQLLQPDELAAGHALHPAPPLPRRLAASQVASTLARGAPTARPGNAAAGTAANTAPQRAADAAARFAVGDAVLTNATHPDHHSRLPAYARGKRGVVALLHGQHVFADSNAQGLGEQPQWLYSVVFEGVTLWGADSDAGLQVSIDAWESTLTPAPP